MKIKLFKDHKLKNTFEAYKRNIERKKVNLNIDAKISKS